MHLLGNTSQLISDKNTIRSIAEQLLGTSVTHHVVGEHKLKITLAQSSQAFKDAFNPELLLFGVAMKAIFLGNVPQDHLALDNANLFINKSAVN
jgi:hypothetical protein